MCILMGAENMLFLVYFESQNKAVKIKTNSKYSELNASGKRKLNQPVTTNFSTTTTTC